jgi:hypothetical protein
MKEIWLLFLVKVMMMHLADVIIGPKEGKDLKRNFIKVV